MKSENLISTTGTLLVDCFSLYPAKAMFILCRRAFCPYTKSHPVYHEQSPWRHKSLTHIIVSWADWLWKSASLKERNNQAVSDVERTCHVIATVYKLKHTLKEGRCRRRFILVWRWFWGDFRHSWRSWSTIENILIVPSTNYAHIKHRAGRGWPRGLSALNSSPHS